VRAGSGSVRGGRAPPVGEERATGACIMGAGRGDSATGAAGVAVAWARAAVVTGAGMAPAFDTGTRAAGGTRTASVGAGAPGLAAALHVDAESGLSLLIISQAAAIKPTALAPTTPIARS
jgi:hypothetical protein